MPFRLLRLIFFTFGCLLVFFLPGETQSPRDVEQIEVALRMIGHQILLDSGDSTSRVLPIIQEEDQYKIQFDSEFEFIPEELVETVKQVVKETSLANSYIVQLEDCETEEIVYSFVVDYYQQSNIIPCKSREQPKSCYNLIFILLEVSEAVGPPDLTSINPSSGSYAKLDRANTGIILGLLLIIAGLLFFLWRKKKKPKLDPNLIPLGEFHFDKRNTELLINHQRTELTHKEAQLLLLLYNAVNTTVEREVILNLVWGDEGDYIGRTLDVFISKLRKKLEADSSVKIVTIRGVGYKLVVNE